MQVPNTNTLDTNGKVQPVLEFHDPAKNAFFQKFVDIAQQCFAFTPQENIPTHNLNFH